MNCSRDMRDALGALGPVDGTKPDLSNLTLSLTTLERGDIVMVASDGLTDNFDPNVCRFSVNTKEQPKQQQPVSSGSRKVPTKPPRKGKITSNSVKSSESSQATTSQSDDTNAPVESTAQNNPLVAQFLRENSYDKQPATSLVRKEPKSKPIPPSFSRSKTSIEMRSSSRRSATTRPVLYNEEGVPYVTPLQRYELSLLLMGDVLRRGISGREGQCATAKKLCESLVNFTFSITAAKRHTLEDVDLYYDDLNGVLKEVTTQEKKARRRRALDKVQTFPGKLDHVTVVAYNVGCC